MRRLVDVDPWMCACVYVCVRMAGAIFGREGREGRAILMRQAGVYCARPLFTACRRPAHTVAAPTGSERGEKARAGVNKSLNTLGWTMASLAADGKHVAG